MKGYLDMGALKPWSLFDLETKENQKYLRGIATYVTEELCEANQILDEINIAIAMEAHHEEKRVELRPLFIEELIDALHFMIELNIYAGIMPEDMDAVLEKQLEAKNIEALKGEPLHAMLRYARHLNIEEQMIQDKKAGRGYLMSENMEYPFPWLTESMQVDLKITTLQTISNLFAAINMLKNKEWRRTETAVNLGYFRTQITNYWIWYMRILDLADFKPQDLYRQFELKHRINVQRIIDKY
jgi:hypothetical protein